MPGLSIDLTQLICYIPLIVTGINSSEITLKNKSRGKTMQLINGQSPIYIFYKSPNAFYSFPSLSRIAALSGSLRTTVNANVSVGSGGCSPGTTIHLNSRTILDSMRCTCNMPRVAAGQIRRPTPNGIIRTPRVPVMSVSYPSPPSKNLSGCHLSGFVHMLGSCVTHAV